MPDEYVVPAAPRPTVAVAGATMRFAVRRIFCVGRNHPEHVREMGATDVRAPPFFFMKPADAVIECGAVVPFPPRTADLHHEIELVAALGHPSQARIWLEVYGELRQNGDIAEMIWTVPEIIAELSTWFALAPGDLIFTGTTAGVGRLNPGDRVRGSVDGVGLLTHTMAAR